MSARCPYKIRQRFAILDWVVNDEPLYIWIMQQRPRSQVVFGHLMAYHHEDNANTTVVCTILLSVQ